GFGCQTLGVNFLGLTPDEQSLLIGGGGLAGVTGCIRFVPPPYGELCALAAGISAWEWSVLKDRYQASNQYLYLYFLGVLQVSACWACFGGTPSPIWLELGIYTDMNPGPSGFRQQIPCCQFVPVIVNGSVLAPLFYSPRTNPWP